MTSTAQTMKNAITLKGSAAIISEYLSKAIHTFPFEIVFCFCFLIYTKWCGYSIAQIMA